MFMFKAGHFSVSLFAAKTIFHIRILLRSGCPIRAEELLAASVRLDYLRYFDFIDFSSPRRLRYRQSRRAFQTR